MTSPLAQDDTMMQGYDAFGNDDASPKTPNTPEEVSTMAGATGTAANPEVIEDDNNNEEEEEETFEIIVETFNFEQNKCVPFPLQVVKETTFADIRATLSNSDEIESNELKIYPMQPGTRFIMRGDIIDEKQSNNINRNSNNNSNNDNNDENADNIYEWSVIELEKETEIECSGYNGRYFVLSFDIRILDGKNLDVTIPVSRYHTIDQIVKFIRNQSNQISSSITNNNNNGGISSDMIGSINDLKILSYNGEKLHNFTNLYSLNIVTDIIRINDISNNSSNSNSIRNLEHSPKVLKSRIEIVIEDRECDISLTLLVFEFWTFKQIIDTYLQESRREKHHNFIFRKTNINNNNYGGYNSNNNNNNNNNLSDLYYNENRTLFSENLNNNGEIFEYSVGSYPIKIYDTDHSSSSHSGYNRGSNASNVSDKFIELNVFDHWTLLQVKESYARLTKKPFLEKDRFICNDRQLEDNIFLWKLRLRDNEELVIDRQELEVACDYICSECGTLMQIRRLDPVGCKECQNNILFKHRTQRICQYNCR